MTREAWLSPYHSCISLPGVFVVISTDSYFSVLFFSFCSLPTKRLHISDLNVHAFGFSFFWTCWDSSEITGFVCLLCSLTLFSGLLVFVVELYQCWSGSQVKQSFPAKSGIWMLCTTLFHAELWKHLQEACIDIPGCWLTWFLSLSATQII